LNRTAHLPISEPVSVTFRQKSWADFSDIIINEALSKVLCELCASLCPLCKFLKIVTLCATEGDTE
jgi:hypothetical protein